MKCLKNPLLIMFFLVMFPTFVFAQIIPYSGLTLEWRGITSFVNEDYPSVNTEKDMDFLYIYGTEEDGVIQQKNVDEDRDELIKIETRELVTGEDKGETTSHWIPTNINLGDKIKIHDKDYIVKSLSDTIYLRDFGQINTIKLSFKETKDILNTEDSTVKDMIEEVKIWYDINTGLKLKQVYTNSYTHVTEYITSRKIEKEEYELRENNVDTDKDGLTDLQELLEEQTNPTLADTDSDGINDKKELNLKTNPLLADTDSDGLNDGDELSINSNPLVLDTDSDGLNDKEEFDLGTSPILTDTDGDFWNDKTDFAKTSFIIPNIFFILILVLIIFLIYTKSKKKDKKKK